MEIVIDIPKKDYIYIAKKHCLPSCDERTLRETCYEMIAKGVPLPKGHGRFGDLSKIYVKLNEAQIEGTPEYKGLGEAKQIVCDAPTIIEADRSDEE